jgi:diguanylate cyclase (GGDEF)-like protein/PAS domain S-box-containing protein
MVALASLAEIQDIVFVKDLEGRYLMVNKAAAAVVGMVPDEMVGKLDTDVLSAEVAAQQRDLDRQVAERGEPVTFEGPLVRDGKPRTVRTTKAPLRDAEGRVFGVIGVSTDVTALRLAEDALRQSEATLAEAQKLTAVGSWQWDLAEDRRSWSDELYRIFGVDQADGPFSFEKFMELVHVEDRERVQAAFARAMESGQHYELVHRLVRPDGEERVLACSARFVHDLDGTVRQAIGAIQDITERQREIERSRASEVQLNAAQELTGVGSWEWDMTANSVEWSDNLYRIFGLERGEFGGTFEAYIEAVHPEDREARKAEVERVVSTGEPNTAEHRIVTPEGEVRTILSSASLVVDADGRRRLIGACQDVTEIRRVERELERRALEDPLTGLGNRTLAFDRLAHALDVARRRDSIVAVLFLDIDGFKEINDELGHAAGDEVLREIAARLRRAVRGSDTVARMGGDEFLIICEDLHEPGASEIVAERIKASFEEEFAVEDHLRRLTISVGAASNTGGDVGVDQLVGEADAAMYRSKAERQGQSQ